MNSTFIKSNGVVPTQAATFEPETVGRTYNTMRYGIHSRRIGGDGTWYGASKYKTLKEATQALRDLGKPLDLGGGFIISFDAGRKDRFEYRIVRIESKCTVEHTEYQLV
jgi:hypothetical protein